MRHDDMKKEKQEEIKKTGLVIAFDHCSTPFWFTEESKGKGYGSNISESDLIELIDQQHISELNNQWKKWINLVHNTENMDEWDADEAMKGELKTIAMKIKSETDLKIYIHKLNKVEGEHYEIEEIVL